MTLTAYEIWLIRNALKSRAFALLELAERYPASAGPRLERVREYDALAERLRTSLPRGTSPDDWTADLTPSPSKPPTCPTHGEMWSCGCEGCKTALEQRKPE